MNEEWKVGDRVMADSPSTYKISDGIVVGIHPGTRYPYEVASETRPGYQEIYSAEDLVWREGCKP